MYYGIRLNRMNKFLDNVNKPADLKGLTVSELAVLAEEVRSLIIDTVSRTGGHLAANLGVVELTIAMLRTFNPPADKILWDVGHQSYAYKILTDRKARFHTLRQMDGISGFMRRQESAYDVFGSGHSGTAVSAALGMAVARDRNGSDEHVIAVLGDGSAGCGISLEGFNNVADATRRLIVVLNDNEMSIAANVGSISNYLGRLLANPRYNRWKHSVESVAVKLNMGWFRSIYYRVEEAIKSLFLRSVLFEEFGLRYIGPVNGHNIESLLDALAIARDSDRPILLHVSTQKGKGYLPAEKEPEKWHSTSGFEVSTGKPVKNVAPDYSNVFGSVLEKIAETDDRIVAITAAMPTGTGLAGFARKFPDRFFDVGISEEHAVVFAAGLAAGGLIPFFAVYSTFAQRSVDCVIHDVCLQGLPVVLCLDRAGIVGDDGPTHHGVFDIALFRPVPGLIIMQPKDGPELANMIFTAVKAEKPVVIRYPRGICPASETVSSAYREIDIGKAEIIRPTDPKAGQHGERHTTVWIWALGDMLDLAGKTSDILVRRGMTVGVVNARFVQPLDEKLLAEQALTASVFITMENGVVRGGFGSGVEEFLSGSGFKGDIVKVGWPDEFIPHGATGELMKRFGLTAEAVADRIRE